MHMNVAWMWSEATRASSHSAWVHLTYWYLLCLLGAQYQLEPLRREALWNACARCRMASLGVGCKIIGVGCRTQRIWCRMASRCRHRHRAVSAALCGSQHLHGSGRGSRRRWDRLPCFCPCSLPNASNMSVWARACVGARMCGLVPVGCMQMRMPRARVPRVCACAACAWVHVHGHVQVYCTWSTGHVHV